MATKTNPEKVARAARDPKRPGELCRAEPASWAPVVNRAKCEGKGDCVEVCPHDVFEVGTMDETAFRALPFFARLKVRAHGKQTAHTPNIDACQACGLCVVACPERAIELVRGVERA